MNILQRAWKAKSNAQMKLQGFGAQIAKSMQRTPEQKLKSGMKAYQEGGGGGRKPQLKDYQ